jgi:hypothetical protein
LAAALAMFVTVRLIGATYMHGQRFLQRPPRWSTSPPHPSYGPVCEY